MPNANHEQRTSLPPLSPEQDAEQAREMGVLRENEIRNERIIEEQSWSMSNQELTNRMVAFQKLLEAQDREIQQLRADVQASRQRSAA